MGTLKRDLEQALQEFYESYNENYTSPEAVTALQKTFQSHNITIEDWNTLLDYLTSNNAFDKSAADFITKLVDYLDEVHSGDLLQLSNKYIKQIDANTIVRLYLNGQGEYQEMVDNTNNQYTKRENFDGENDESYIDTHLSQTGSIYTAVTGDNSNINVNLLGDNTSIGISLNGDNSYLKTVLDGYSAINFYANGNNSTKSLNYCYLSSGYKGDNGTGANNAPLIFFDKNGTANPNKYGLYFNTETHKLQYCSKENNIIQKYDLDFVPKLTTQGFKIYAHQGPTQYELNYGLLAMPDSVVLRTGVGNVLMTDPTEDLAGVNKQYADATYLSKQTTTKIDSHVYSFTGSTQTVTPFTTLPEVNSIVYRDYDGNFCSGTPTQKEHVVNKNYTDTNFVGLSNEQTITGIKHFKAGDTPLENIALYKDDTVLEKVATFKAGINVDNFANGNYTVNSSSDSKILTNKEYVDGVAENKADLVDGLVPASQLPSYVDDVVEFKAKYMGVTWYASCAGTGVSIGGLCFNDAIASHVPGGTSGAFYKSFTKKISEPETAWLNDPITYKTQIIACLKAVAPETGKIYVGTSDSNTYRWTGSNLVEISKSLSTNSQRSSGTSGQAYRADFGAENYADILDLKTGLDDFLKKVADSNLDMNYNYQVTNVSEIDFAPSSSVGTIAKLVSEIDSANNASLNLYTKKVNINSLACKFSWGEDEPITFYKPVRANTINDETGHNLVKYNTYKNIFGNASYPCVLVGSSDRPVYSKSDSDLSGTELALKSDIKNGTLTIAVNGTAVGTFTANQSSDVTIPINYINGTLPECPVTDVGDTYVLKSTIQQLSNSETITIGTVKTGPNTVTDASKTIQGNLVPGTIKLNNTYDTNNGDGTGRWNVNDLVGTGYSATVNYTTGLIYVQGKINATGTTSRAYIIRVTEFAYIAGVSTWVKE